MARPGKFDHLKPEIFRLIQEGVAWKDIRAQYPDLPERTLANWIDFVKNQATAESTAKPPEPRLPIDPESPIEKIKNALWDIVHDPQGKGAAVQALQVLLKIEAPWLASNGSAPVDDEVKEVKITRRVVDALNP
jgi:hypothetical protein